MNDATKHAILQGITLAAGVAALGFGVTVLSEYFADSRSAAAYRGAPQCERPSATPTSSCVSAVDATVARVSSWPSRGGSSHSVELELPTGSQWVWLSDGPPPARGTVVGPSCGTGGPRSSRRPTV